MKRTLLLAGAAMLSISFAGAQVKKTTHTVAHTTGAGGSFKTLPGGVKYLIARDEKNGTSPKVGDVVKMNIVFSYKDASMDTTVMDTRKTNNGQPVEFPVPPQGGAKSDWSAGILLMTPGDSAVFKMPVDSVRKGARNGSLPEFMKDGQYLTVKATLISWKPAAQYKAESEKAQAEAQAKAKEQAAAQTATDEQMIKDFLSKNSINAQRTANGLYYSIEKPGSGPNAAAGQEITMNYTGMTMDGKKFDSNVDSAFHHVSPFKFKLGQHMVISGWDEGIALMNKGTKGRLFIPSGMAYGPSGRPPQIPQNAILIFDVEVVDIAVAAPAPQQMSRPVPGGQKIPAQKPTGGK